MRTDLTDHYDNRECAVWLTCWPPDRIVEPAATQQVGDPPGWLGQLVQQVGWPAIVNPEGQSVDRWLLQHGIAPLQPFWVRVGEFRLTSWFLWGADRRPEWKSEIVQVARWSQEAVLASWKRHFETAWHPVGQRDDETV